MCITAQEIITVESTKIFVGINEYNEQVTIYSNFMKNEVENNAMILPVPHPETAQIFVCEDKKVFDDLDKMFRQIMSRGMDGARGMLESYDSHERLEIFKVGCYDASIAMNFEDMSRVDNSFKIEEECIQLLKTYPPHYGFIICKLQTDANEYTPFAYRHRIDQDKSLFIPTKHYHGKKEHKREYFDHALYIHGADSSSMSKYSKGQFQLVKNPAGFYRMHGLKASEHLSKYVIQGYHDNTDFKIPVKITEDQPRDFFSDKPQRRSRLCSIM